MLLESALAADSTYREAWYYRGLSLADQQNLEEADSCFSRAIALSPVYTDIYVCADIYCARGRVSSQLGNYASALADFDEVIRLQPTLAKGYEGRAVVNEELGNIRGASSDLECVISITGGRSQDCHWRGLLRLQEGDTNSAFVDFNRAIALNPENSDAFSDRACLRYQRKDFAGALADCDSALMIVSDHYAASYTRALALDMLGLSNEAAEAYRRFLDLGSETDPAVPQVRRRLKELGA
jgi:tetratricopeptide (TPR) repeat protein